MEFCRIQGVTEEVKREFGVNLTAGRVNAIEMTQKVMQAPSMDTLLQGYLAHKAKKSLPGPDLEKVG